MESKVIISGKFPSLNDYTKACRANKFAGAQMKKREENRIGAEILSQKVQPIKGRVEIEFHWIEPDMRRDLDNICFAKKFVLDSLVIFGIIEGDSQRYVTSFRDCFDVDRGNPRVEIIIRGVE